MRTHHLNGLLIAAILATSTAPLFAQAQQPDAAKLKADAQNVVSIIKGDKAKAQTYCQILNLGDELDDVDEQKDRKKAEDLSQKIDELEKTLGPEYLALAKALENMVQPRERSGKSFQSLRASINPAKTNRSRTSIADEMREEHRRRVLGE
jgi:DNA anti-recombination protein RmuC